MGTSFVKVNEQQFGTLLVRAAGGIGAALEPKLDAPTHVINGDAIDLTNAIEVDAALETFSTAFDTVIFSWLDPASFVAKPIHELTEDEWDAASEKSMRAAFIVLQRVYARLNDGGRVIIVLPTTAATGVAELVPLCSAVEAIRVMAKAVARRWGARSITVNTIEVDLATFIVGDGDRANVPSVPVLGVPALSESSVVNDVVGLISLLRSESSSGLTGALLVADRGTVMQP
ncbi:MAG: hypothetical protein RLZZ31_1681 [Actinomycetota bacterium]